MLFRLKNTGTTYQRLVNKMFAQQIRLIVEVYIDDMLVKRAQKVSHLDDLRETFTLLPL